MAKLLPVLLAVVLFGSAFAEQSSFLEGGAWVLYEGGDAAPEVLVFMAGGLGTCYELCESLVSDTWVWEQQIKKEYLTNPQEFSWVIEFVEQSSLHTTCFLLTIQIDELITKYSAELIPDMSGTGLDCLVLTVMQEGGGGGWLRVY